MKADFDQLTWNQQLEDDCRQLVRLAVREDLDRQCDWTTVSLVPPDASGQATVVAHLPGVIAGLRAVQTAIDEMQARVVCKPLMQDGEAVQPGQPVVELQGSARDLLTTERILLNLAGRLSGIATLTARYVHEVRGTAARIYDTRKTTLGWRRLEKLAVRAGGGCNHRVGLFAAVMIKDNHLAFGVDQGLSPAAAVHQARNYLRESLDADSSPHMIVEVEVDSIDQLREVLPASPDIVLLDNMSLEALSQCVELRDAQSSKVELEASGGVNLNTVRQVADTGVERISVGALTHAAVSLDLGLEWSWRR